MQTLTSEPLELDEIFLSYYGRAHATEVLTQALGERRRSLLWWSLGLVALVALNVAFYPSIRDDTAINDYVKDLPESLRGLFAGGELDIASPAGYLNSQIYALMAPLVLLIFAIGAGATPSPGRRSEGRSTSCWPTRCAAATTSCSGSSRSGCSFRRLALVLLATVAVGSWLVDLEIGFDRVVAASVSVGVLALFFGTIALAAGSIRPGRARAIAVAAGVAVASWLLDGLGQAVDVLDSWRPVSPYYQAIGRNPLREGAPWSGWVILAA